MYRDEEKSASIIKLKRHPSRNVGRFRSESWLEWYFLQ